MSDSSRDNSTEIKTTNKGMNVWARLLCAVLAIIAGTVFVKFLIDPNDLSFMEIGRELPFHLLFTAINEHSSGFMLIHWSYDVSSVTGLLACLLALVLCVSSSEKHATKYLTGALSLGCFVLAYISFVRPFYVTEISIMITSLDVLMGALMGWSMWFWMNFVFMYPQKVQFDDYIDFIGDQPFLKNVSVFSEQWQKKEAQFFKKHNRSIWKNSSGKPTWVYRLMKAMTAWVSSVKGAVMFSIIIAVLFLFDATTVKQGFFGPIIYVVAFALLFLVMNLGLTKYTDLNVLLDEKARRQSSWLILGMMFLIGLCFLLILLWTTLIVFGNYELGGFFMFALFILCVPVYWFTMIAMLIVSIFYYGSLDPRLVIKKSAVYGVIGIGITTLFVAIEGVLSTQAVLQFGLHDQTAAIVTGTLTAVMFGPVRNKMEVSVDGFINRILPISALSEGKRRTSAVVFNDLSSYTKVSEEHEDAALMLVSIIHQVGAKAALEFNGRVVKTIGDAIMLEFPSADDALKAVKQLHTKYTQLSDQYKLPSLPIHTGVHWGEVVRANDGDIYGKHVNLAARLEGVAGPSEIVFSSAAYQQLSSTEGFEQAGGIELKNIADPVVCYRFSTAQ
ncbi:MAG: adenylate/guanylate cyclase domain-containing protein [Marinicella sp.]